MSSFTPDGRPLLNSEQAAVRLGVGERMIRRMVAERRVPFLRVGKFVRFDQGDLDRWLVSNRQDSDD